MSALPARTLSVKHGARRDARTPYSVLSLRDWRLDATSPRIAIFRQVQPALGPSGSPANVHAREERRYPLGYMPALDGLRGVAILLVLTFHTVTGFTGGFLEFDLFFVLSGYLITGILLREKTLDRAALLEFYRRRALRLLPALLLVCLVYLAFAFLFLPDRARALKDVGITLTSVANWTRAFNLGIPVHLGHTWSLAIEDQFYLLWPLALAALLRFGGARTAFMASLAAILACMLWRIWLTTRERQSSVFTTGSIPAVMHCFADARWRCPDWRIRVDLLPRTEARLGGSGPLRASSFSGRLRSPNGAVARCSSAATPALRSRIRS